MWNTILIIVYLFVNVIAVVLLVREGSKPYRIWAWLMTIFAFPFVGALVFFFFGSGSGTSSTFSLLKSKGWLGVIRFNTTFDIC